MTSIVKQGQSTVRPAAPNPRGFALRGVLSQSQVTTNSK